MYKDFRDAFVEPTPEEIFNMVTKENPQTFYVGKMVMATVTGFAHKKPQGKFFKNQKKKVFKFFKFFLHVSESNWVLIVLIDNKYIRNLQE